MAINDVIKHYDLLIAENNDPVHDPKPLRDYMDKWDGQPFIERLMLNRKSRVLEIGVGTGRLAVRVAPLCCCFHGIDISPKTIERAKQNLSTHNNVSLYCGDFLTYESTDKFDVIYSSLTFMHIAEKQKAINKVTSLLKCGGRFVLSIDKNQEAFIDAGSRKVAIYPDSPLEIKTYIESAGLLLTEQYETEFAHVFVAKKALICYCGHDCSRCVTYVATIADDNSLRERSQRFYKEQFGQEKSLDKFNCLGGRTDNIFELCSECPFRKCCMDREIEYCDRCPDYPCAMLKAYKAKYVNKTNQI